VDRFESVTQTVSDPLSAISFQSEKPEMTEKKSDPLAHADDYVVPSLRG
jgi:hypothetical protein